jgi:hypothetical protein
MKAPAEILVYQSPKKARLYLFSLNPRIFEVMIHKNAEPGWNNSVIHGGTDEVIFSDVTVITRQKRRGLGRDRDRQGNSRTFFPN